MIIEKGFTFELNFLALTFFCVTCQGQQMKM
jgi:hypothetical protein